MNSDFQNGFERVSAALLMVWGPSARSLVVVRPGKLSAVPILAIESLFHVESSLVRFPDPPYGVGRENEPPRSWEFYFGAR